MNDIRHSKARAAAAPQDSKGPLGLLLEMNAGTIAGLMLDGTVE